MATRDLRGASYCAATWLTEKVTPAESASTAVRPGGLSNGATTAAPPWRSASATAASTSSTQKATDQGAGSPPSAPARGPARPGRRHRRDALTRAGLPRLAADVAGQAEERHWAEALRGPAEHRAVERRGALRIGRVEAAHRPCPRLVDQLRAMAGARFP